MQQKEWSFRHHSDERLLDELKATHQDELSNAVKIIWILEEVDRRRLYAQLGHSSLFGFCQSELNMSEHEAGLRITVARTVRKFPVIIGMIARGELHLSGAAKLAPHLSEENHRALLEAAVGKTKREIEELIAARFPKQDVSESIRRLPKEKPAMPAPLLGLPLAVQPHETTASLPVPAASSVPAMTPSVGAPPVTAPVKEPASRRAVVRGESTVENLRLRCRTHNGFTARQELGDEYVDLMAQGFRPVPRTCTEEPASEGSPARDARPLTTPPARDQAGDGASAHPS